MVYVITFSWFRGQYFAWMLNKSLHKLGVRHMVYFDDEILPPFRVVPWVGEQGIDPMVTKDLNDTGTIIKYKNNYFGGHAGWTDVMKKVEAYKVARDTFNIQPNDFLIDMDDDTYMCNDSILKLLTNDVDLVGLQHTPPINTKIGPFGHMSGACVAMRGDLLHKLTSQGSGFWDRVHAEFREFTICEMWDVVVSYACVSLGAIQRNIEHTIDLNISAEDHFSGKVQGNFFHFAGPRTEFLGEPLNIKFGGRHDIPLVLHKKGLI